MISNIVDAVTGAGGVAILDLHWSDDDNEQGNMPKKGATTFWDSVASKFANNDHGFYELYNEPHNNDFETWFRGNDEFDGMMSMRDSVLAQNIDAVLVIAGAQSYAYDADSLI
jgi:predicted ATP-grasp superfamily ATP-dependent carboligase